MYFTLQIKEKITYKFVESIKSEYFFLKISSYSWIFYTYANGQREFLKKIVLMSNVSKRQSV